MSVPANKMLLITLLVCISGCVTTPVPDLGQSVRSLKQELAAGSFATHSPGEYRSFVDTVSRAEQLAGNGSSTEAEQYYRLALVKGNILREKRGKPAQAAVVNAETVHIVDAASEVDPPQVEQEEQPPTLFPEIQLLPEPEPARQVSLLETVKKTERHRLLGARAVYLVRKNDTLPRIGARLGVDWRALAKANQLDPKQKLRLGQAIYYDNHKIVPKRLREGIIINIPDRTLYLFRNGGLYKAFPVAAGKSQKPGSEVSWMTPTGKFTITAKQKNPTWRVPPSIQKEMELSGAEVLTEVPPGNTNPLGKYALRTSLQGILIHSTVSPGSIYTFSSHGCIRIIPDHMEELFQAVTVRTPGEIVYQPVKLLAAKSGPVFLEVHRDVYNVFKGGLFKEAKRLIENERVSKRVDWQRVEQAVRDKNGIPEDISAPDESLDQVSDLDVNRLGRTHTLFR
jgi:lipoprotein-anchoring transpeptidase ErfK/SrfK